MNISCVSHAAKSCCNKREEIYHPLPSPRDTTVKRPIYGADSGFSVAESFRSNREGSS